MRRYPNKVFKLLGKVQHYAWGGHSYLPHLLHDANPEGKPFAEYWMGAHDHASAVLLTPDGEQGKLNEYIRAYSRETLGPVVTKQFGALPYLLKILDVKDMLSIQVHPTKQNAEIEYACEQTKGIPPDAPHRNYKDDNHKPELMLALSEFWLLHGFKEENFLKKILQQIKELNFLLPVFEQGGYRLLYQTVMEMDQQAVNGVLEPLLQKIIPAYEQNELSKNDENFWAARAALTYNQPGKTDRGIFSIYFFNLVNLHPGETVFQDAGLPHAYLEGQNVEIMANSDNVLRGGLTPKHVDVKELLKHIVFDATIPNVIPPTELGNGSSAYITPAPDFELRKLDLEKNKSVQRQAVSPEIYFVLQGSGVVREKDQDPIHVKRGDSWIAFYEAAFTMEATGDLVVYSAAVPEQKK